MEEASFDFLNSNNFSQIFYKLKRDIDNYNSIPKNMYQFQEMFDYDNKFGGEVGCEGVIGTVRKDIFEVNYFNIDKDLQTDKIIYINFKNENNYIYIKNNKGKETVFTADAFGKGLLVTGMHRHNKLPFIYFKEKGSPLFMSPIEHNKLGDKDKVCVVAPLKKFEITRINNLIRKTKNIK